MNILNILYRNRDKQNVSMKTKRNRVMKSKLILIAVCSILLSRYLYSQTATHPWHAVDNGGGKSTSGSVTLRSSWGQPNVQKMTASSVKLESGYLPGLRQLLDSITITLPPAPILVSPADSAISQPTTVELSWYPAAGANSYRLQVSVSSSFTTTVFDDSTLIGTSQTVSSLTGNTFFYWHVSAKNIAGTSGWSSIWKFTTMISTPSAPMLVFPLDGSTNQSTVLYLRWRTTSLATSYHLQFAKDSGFTSNLIVNDSTLADTSFQVAGLSNDTTYFWRIRAKGVAGNGNWSGAWKFKTIMVLPNQVTLLTPSNNAIIGTDSVVFVWFQSQPKVTRYWFEFAVDSSFIFVQVDTNVAETFLVKRSLHNQSYWWKVRAYNSAGWGAYSEARKQTVNITDVANERSLPTEFALDQNYPNPFNPSTVINYQIPVNSWVTLKVYNMLGQEVTTLVDGIQEVGYKSVEFYSSTLPSGIYTYRLQAGTFIDVKKMLLLK